VERQALSRDKQGEPGIRRISGRVVPGRHHGFRSDYYEVVLVAQVVETTAPIFVWKALDWKSGLAATRRPHDACFARWVRRTAIRAAFSR